MAVFFYILVDFPLELLGYSGELEWTRNEHGLTVVLPEDHLIHGAFALRIR
ncbi:hypothetical protein [Paenibacillus aquistagni]|uniref:hypothetical protein n=1 Tax=Paenibacillus aquistagni TaxID=1852522 RepID=UPI001980900E|nr:hypothetical protein [Paenibacillus aquistagni]